jgi:hypothetical protein
MTTTHDVEVSVFEELVRTSLAEVAPAPMDVVPPPHVQGFEVDRVLHMALLGATASSEWLPPGVDARDQKPHEPSAEVRALQEAAAALVNGSAHGRPADVSALFSLAEQIRGLALRELAEMDAVGTHVGAGAVTAATWLRDDQVISDITARAHVRLASSLRDDLPQLGELLRSGRTTLEHARAVVVGTRGLDKSLVRDSEPALCDLVTKAAPERVRAELRERAEALNPELGRDAERRAHAQRGFTVDGVGSIFALGGSLGVEDGEIVRLALDLETQRDRVEGDQRSVRQRQADVLVQWARESAAAHGGAAGSVADDVRTTRTHLIVTCTAEQLVAAVRGTVFDQRHSDDGRSPGRSLADDVTGQSWQAQADDARTRVPAGGSFGLGALVSSVAVRRLVCDAAISLAVLPDGIGADAGTLGPELLDPRPDPLYVGRAARIVTAAQWKALVVRDRHCVVKGCRRRPRQCEAHHVRHWLDGGSTDLDNMVLLCFQHHHEHHDRGHDLQHRDGRWMTRSGWTPHAPP